jgi:stress response protein YsnF
VQTDHDNQVKLVDRLQMSKHTVYKESDDVFSGPDEKEHKLEMAMDELQALKRKLTELEEAKNQLQLAKDSGAAGPSPPTL